MKGQVLVRQQSLGNDKNLRPGHVLSEERGKVRVKLEGALHPIEVDAADIIQTDKVYGSRGPGQGSRTLLERQYPGHNSLGGRLG
jgi:hypothetical protein